MIDMTNQNGSKVAGRDYSVALIDAIPMLIGKRSMTIRELSEKAGRSETVVRKIINRLHGSGVYIAKWKRTGNKIAACYRAGKEKDAEKLKPLTNTEICRRYKANNRDTLNEKQRIKRLGTRLITKRLKQDHLMAAIYR